MISVAVEDKYSDSFLIQAGMAFFCTVSDKS